MNLDLRIARARSRLHKLVDESGFVAQTIVSLAAEAERKVVNARFDRLIHFRARSEGQKRRWRRQSA